MESDLTSLSLQNAETGSSETLATGRELLSQLRSAEAIGRLVIGTEHLSSNRLELRDGDTLMIPPRPQVVTVLGEIQQNTSHLYDENLSRDDYINLSGGMTRLADKGRIYIVRANGALIAQRNSRWLGRGERIDVRPGDTIVVPMDTDRMRPMTFWTNVTQILYQGAIAVAAIKTFDE
jgi:protein involved in polysaccharide export with SLBB domain